MIMGMIRWKSRWYAFELPVPILLALMPIFFMLIFELLSFRGLFR
jgi:hypothetical protein